MSKNLYSRVLVIDDSRMDNMLIRMILNTINFSDEVVCYESPMDAIKYLNETNSAGEQYPQVIFLDINMPIINGFQLLDRIIKAEHAGFKECKVYMLSSSDEAEDIRKASLYPNIVRYLQKPLDKEDLKEGH
ncbi:MAG: response regulator [Cytophagaceae bacterium]